MNGKSHASLYSRTLPRAEAKENMFVFLQRFRSYEGILIECSLGDHRPSQTVTRGLIGLPGPPLDIIVPSYTVLRA